MADRSRYRECRRARPAVESLEGRALLAAGHSPSNPIPIHPEPITQPSPQQLGAAFHEVLAIQASTYQGISAAHRRMYAAYAHFAAQADPAIPHDRRVLQQGATLLAGGEQGLVVARGVEQLNAYTDKIYVPQHLFTTLNALVREARKTGARLVHSADRGSDRVIIELNGLAARLGRESG